MRFYDPDQGAIRLDGKNIRQATRRSLRQSYAMVLQDTWLFTGTVFDNLAYGKAKATLAEVQAAAQAAHIHDFIMSLPKGYDTLISEDGTGISQGQKQLLTIARAMLLDADLLILDEATSNVDTQTELLIQAAMTKLMKGKTSFVIAHRLSTIRHADTILVVEQGSQELTSKELRFGPFLMRVQAPAFVQKWFREVEKLAFALEQVPVENQSARASLEERIAQIKEVLHVSK